MNLRNILLVEDDPRDAVEFGGFMRAVQQLGIFRAAVNEPPPLPETAPAEAGPAGGTEPR